VRVACPDLFHPSPWRPDKLRAPGYATFRGVYRGITVSYGGRHPEPVVRPRTTIEGPSPDTAWPIFWEVTGLVHLAREDWVTITALTAEGQGKPLTKRPRRPLSLPRLRRTWRCDRLRHAKPGRQLYGSG
jgi:hypothetical protein